MEQKIAIKIENPKEEKVSVLFFLMLLLALLFTMATLGLLIIEFLGMHIALPIVFAV